MPPIPLLVLSTAKAGGAERVVAALVGGLPQFGFSPTVLLLESGPIEAWLAEQGCDRVVVAEAGDGVVELARRLIDDTGARLVLTRKSNTHVHGGRAAFEAGIPAVWWQPDVPRATPDQLEAASQPVAAIVCASDLVIDAQRRLTPSTKIVKLAPGIPVEVFATRDVGAGVRNELAWRETPLIGIVGRIQHFKGQHVFLEAAALVARRHPDARFVVVGGVGVGTEREYAQWLELLARRRGLADRVRFVGHRRDVAAWFAALDVAVNATDGEPFGLVILEAMATGTPIVATNLGGPAEIIADGVSGLLVPPGNPEAMAEAITRLLEQPDLCARLAAAGRERARSFTIERMCQDFASLFTSVLADWPDRASSPVSSGRDGGEQLRGSASDLVPGG